MFLLIFFFFKQKTAYEMRISDWSSDVCSSDLIALSFSVVVATIVAHGFSISHVARWLGVTGASRQGILIVGSTHWSLSLADHLRQLGISVMVSDSSWERLSAARQQGIPSFHGEILAEETEHRLDLSQFKGKEHTSELQSLMRI